ncbi:phytanoyl-CoA dioxygenase family protein [Paenibacillus montanisoli]|uniref:phytanoyl-CoA dioxygenase family protein n=1 Tax=Paenibacillus montanisoli TaxID=2081970 RepID=UPI001402F24E|nr:phytanoyl-CoA dioxygenase family protein [Paenibacillus montanisoli]
MSKSDIEQFIELGYVRVEEAFPRQNALEAQKFLWSKVEEQGILKEDKSTWTQAMVHLKEQFTGEVFQACNTQRFADAIEDLIGVGRWKEYAVYDRNDQITQWGWWPINFSAGADKEWDVPTDGWHWDGMQRPHYVDSPEQGLLPLCVFSDIGPRGGSTLVAEGSHRIVARFLEKYNDGPMLDEAIEITNREHPWLAELTAVRGKERLQEGSRIERFMNRTHVDEFGTHLRVVETPASAGDVYLCHPMLYHSASQNHSGVPRFMCNRATPLKKRLNLRRQNPAEYSPLELSIKQALVRPLMVQ